MQRKVGRRKWARGASPFPNLWSLDLPCTLLPVTRVSRAFRACLHAKNEALEEEEWALT